MLQAGLHVQHRTLLVQLLERAAAGTVALTVAPTLVMAIHLLHQLNLKISILRHGACLVASAIVAAPGMAHLHLHHVGAELSVRRGRLPVMVPTVVMVLVVLLYRKICKAQRFRGRKLQLCSCIALFQVLGGSYFRGFRILSRYNKDPPLVKIAFEQSRTLCASHIAEACPCY